MRLILASVYVFPLIISTRLSIFVFLLSADWRFQNGKKIVFDPAFDTGKLLACVQGSKTQSLSFIQLVHAQINEW